MDAPSLRGRIDVDAFIDAYPVEAVVARYRGVRRRGERAVAQCVSHDDDKASMWIYPAEQRPDGRVLPPRCHCYACGFHGNVLDVVMVAEGVGLREAARILVENVPPSPAAGGRGGPGREPKAAPALAPAMPVPRSAPPLMDRARLGHTVPLYRPSAERDEDRWKAYRPTMVHEYRDKDGGLLGHVLRLEFSEPDGGRKKIFLPVTWCRAPDGAWAWSVVGFPNPKPLYGLDRIGDVEAYGARRRAVLCEGEKKADAAQRLLGPLGWTAVGYPNGASNTDHVDLSALRGWDVWVWPDNDAPGRAAADNMAAALAAAGAASVYVVEPPEGVRAKWDLADAEAEGWSGWQVEAHLRMRSAAPAAAADLALAEAMADALAAPDPAPAPDPAAGGYDALFALCEERPGVPFWR